MLVIRGDFLFMMDRRKLGEGRNGVEKENDRLRN
jgi:hypothetical protein